MDFSLKSLCWFGAMLAVAAAGIFQVIDQASMIVLTVALLVTGRGSLCGCRLPWRSKRA